MKNHNIVVLFAACIVVLTMCFISISAAQRKNTEISIVPKPEKIDVKSGVFAITPKTEILTDRETQLVGEYFAGLILPATGMTLDVKSPGGAEIIRNAIVLRIDTELKELGSEGYKLSVTPEGVNIAAAAPAGVFYGVQTLRQLLPLEIESKTPVSGVDWTAPCVEITDKPRFSWRGLMLDPARHFLSKDFILKYIDVMSMYKLNRLHLHLTDDQGWRLEIKRYPELTKIGAWRGKSDMSDMFWHPTGEPHGGFYTQDDMREIVAYAEKRYVTIVPEIEMPGHSQAALASIRGLACTDQKFKVSTHWGVHTDIYCAGNEKTFEFLEDVLTEVAALFPGEYIHIGGDEAPKYRWQHCPRCQARIKDNNLKDENELQSYFIKRIETFINSKGKKLIGWDEILQGGLPPRATVMSWQGIEGGISAARQGHDVIMTPMNDLYFDYPQAATGEPEAFQGKPVTLCHVYAFEPVPNILTPDQATHIIGAQGSVWGEYIADIKYAEYMTYPRAAALAENLWTQRKLKNFDDFLNRLRLLDDRMELMGMNYRKPRDNEAAQCK
jgi:hexosaminidase